MNLVSRRTVLSPYRNSSTPFVTPYSATVETNVTDSESDFSVHMPVYRTYTSGGVPTSFSNCPASADYDTGSNTSLRTSVWSCKPDLTDQAAGNNDAAWTTFLDSIPNNHPMMITMQHEPDSKVRKGTFTLAQWQAGWSQWTQFMTTYKAANPNKMISTYLCLTNGPWTFSKTTNPDDYYNAGQFDVWAPDCYMDGSQSYENGVQNAVGDAVQYGINKGSALWALPELGVYYDTSDTSYQATMIAATSTFVDSTGGAQWVCYYSINNSNPDGTDVRPWPNSFAELSSLIASHQ